MDVKRVLVVDRRNVGKRTICLYCQNDGPLR